MKKYDNLLSFMLIVIYLMILIVTIQILSNYPQLLN